MSLHPFTVTYQTEDKGWAEGTEWTFDCQARDAHHAVEQCQSDNPGCTVVRAVQGDEPRMRVTITIDCDSPAFAGEQLGPELHTILQGIASRIPISRQAVIYEWAVYRLSVEDSNGVKVGLVELDPDAPAR